MRGLSLGLKLAAVLSAAGVSFGAMGAIRATTPTQWPGGARSWQMKRHAEKLAQVAKGGAKIVFIGDSITHFWETNGRNELAKHFSGDFAPLNLGTSADRTEHVLWRLDHGELDGFEAKIVFIMIGTNNAGHFPFSAEPPVDAVLGIRAILDRVAKKQPKAQIVLIPIFPRGADANDPVRLRNDVVNREIRRFVDGRRILWLDFSDSFVDAEGRLNRRLFPDLLHPSGAGYDIWARAMNSYVAAAMSGGRARMPSSRFVPKPASKFRLSTHPVSRIRNEGYGKTDWWLDRLQRNRNEIADAKGEVDLVFFGDSITHNWERRVPNLFASLRKTYRTLNLGYSGDCTEHLLWRGENGELDGYKAKCVMLMIGTNNTCHRMDKAEDTAAGIKAILEMIARKQPQAKVLLLPIFPVGDSPREKRRVRNEEVNRLIRSYADGEKVIWVDFNAKFLDAKGDVKGIMPDRVHPNEAGYRLWLDAVMPHFKRICGK